MSTTSGRLSRRVISTPFTASVVAAREMAIFGGRIEAMASTARLEELADVTEGEEERENSEELAAVSGGRKGVIRSRITS
jgi:hypothetical protein